VRVITCVIYVFFIIPPTSVQFCSAGCTKSLGLTGDHSSVNLGTFSAKLRTLGLTGDHSSVNLGTILLRRLHKITRFDGGSFFGQPRYVLRRAPNTRSSFNNALNSSLSLLASHLSILGSHSTLSFSPSVSQRITR